MNNIKKCIDSGLGGMKLSSDFIYQVETRGNSKKMSYNTIYRMRYSAVAAVLCIILFGTVAFAAGTLIYSKIKVNQEDLPDLEPMEVVSLQSVEGTVTEYGDIEKTYGSMEELERDLGIKILGTDFATDNPYTKIFYKKIGDGYNVISIREYILGDLTNFREWNGVNVDSTVEGNDEWYAWTQGCIYKSPVNLKIEIISDPAQQELDTEYMGYYKYVETFTSEQGYTVNVLQDTIEEEQQTTISEAYTQQTQMVFVADGIRYTLSGRVPVETMKEIVDSMK